MNKREYLELRNKISEAVKNIINELYEKYGCKDCNTYDVDVELGKDITITLNSEDPFIGHDFFQLINELIDKMEENGFDHKSKGFIYDFYIVKFTTKK